MDQNTIHMKQKNHVLEASLKSTPHLANLTSAIRRLVEDDTLRLLSPVSQIRVVLFPS